MKSTFDGMAADYDREFSHTFLGGLLRKRVWRHIDQHFQANDHILELNCGTGEDAIHLIKRGVNVHATDVSNNMLQVVKKKADGLHSQQNPSKAQLSYEQVDINKLDQWQCNIKFDGVISNFGGLNCVADLTEVAEQLHRLCKPEAKIIVCIMGPFLPWEWLWFCCRGEFKKAFRRLTPGGVRWRDATIYYPSQRQVKHSFANFFNLQSCFGLGALVPPPYTEEWACKHPRLIKKLDRWEQACETMFPLRWLADHYVMTFVNKP